MDSDAEQAVSEDIFNHLDQPATEASSAYFADPFTAVDLREGSSASGSLYAGSEAEVQASDYGSEGENGHLSLKRSADDPTAHRPFKRQKGLLNVDYLDLLNIDIGDAAHQVCLSHDDDVDPSQLGMTYWSTVEKTMFFEAVARLGKDDLPGIASRIGTKSVIEVSHYLVFLQDAHRLRRTDGLRAALEFAQYPAAVELSQPCCHALDEAADALSVRLERREMQREKGKWGEAWDITPRVAGKYEQDKYAVETQQMPSAQLFHLSTWLQLSNRIFMNSSIPSDNWNYLDDHPPSIWATTFEDFYSLALSITRRLVQTTIFMSMSRIRTKREMDSKTRSVVHRRDVEAAIASLGLTANSRGFWLKSARRLRLEVYEGPPDRDEEYEEEPLTFDEVEAALAEDCDIEKPASSDPDPDLRLPKLEDLSEEEPMGESGYETTGTGSDEEAQEINMEANEVLQYSTADFPETFRTKESLKLRIATERHQEQYAESCDQAASCQAEADMWEILQKPPPIELPKVHDPGPQPKSNMDVESIYPIGHNWRSGVKYRSEWEAGEVPGS